MQNNHNDKHLFRKIILSFFPSKQRMGEMNPGGVFISFISTKQFFSLVNRRIVENYKINLFDVALDPFEVKVGLGDEPGLQVKEVDNYYGYAACANLNGYRFLSPGTLGLTISLVTSMYVYDIFSSSQQKYLNHFMHTVYLLSFVFAARIKVFPFATQKENYEWFVEVFFAFYELSFQRIGQQYDGQIIQEYKAQLLKEPQVFFCLIFFYQRLNNLFDDGSNEIYSWLFYDDLKESDSENPAKKFIAKAFRYARTPSFSLVEKTLMETIFPADVLLRYMCLQDHEKAIIQHILFHVYDKKQLDSYMYTFLQNDEQWEDFVGYITDYKHFKASFFEGIQKFIRLVVRTDAEYDHKTEQEINQFMSAVGESDSMEGIKVPEKLKKESNIVEKLLNFYVTFLGGIRVSRGDNFFVRLMRRPIIQELINQENLIGHKKDNLYYFGALLYAYSKNIFYYKHAFDNIRSGKEKFMLPFKAKFKEVYSNMFIVRMLDENFLATLLQDINQHDIKIYVKTPSLLQRFQDTFGARISSLVNENDTGVIQTVYSPMQKIFAPGYPFVSTLEKYLKPSDIVHIKEHAYFLDFWLYTEFLNHLVDIETPLYDTYDTMVIAGILATIRETLFGFCLYTSFLRKQKDITEHHIQMLALIYFTDIVNVHEEFFDILYAAYQKIYEVFDPFLADWAKFDDNPGYLQFGHDNWIKFYREKEGKNVVSSLSGEDVMWLRGYLKNITYYNRRYLIPQ